MPEPTIATETEPAQFHRANSIADLTVIENQAINIATCERPQLLSLGDELSQEPWPDSLEISGVFQKKDPERARQQLNTELSESLQFINHELRSKFIHDILENVLLFSEEFSSQKDSFRYALTVLNHVMCPRFHIDYYGLRLIVTYFGEATEWTLNTNIELDVHGNPIQPVNVLDENKFFQLKPMSLTLLKGNEYKPGHRGVVHRSPKNHTSQSRRVILRLEA